MHFRRYFAEFLGTMMLVVLACGVAAVSGCSAKADAAYLVTALSFGLVSTVLAYALGGVSGCHINPAVSFGKFLCGKLSGWEFLAYATAQTFGGIAGGAILYGILGEGSLLGANALYEDNLLSTLVIEGILTAFFVFSVLAVTERAKSSELAGVAVGASLTLVHLFGIFFTGTSVNPARSLGPALFVGGAALENVWVFWVAPLLGAFVASLIYLFFFGKWQGAVKTEKTVKAKAKEDSASERAQEAK
ncbi:MAG: aquaporin [Clostridia bacterium]|nr:aquaporin [Clostridia bacterium]